MFQSKGFTLLELLFVLFIISILSLIGIFSSYSLVSKTEQQIVLDSLRSAIQYAKIKAIYSGKTVFLSSLDDNANWNEGVKLTQVNRMTQQVSLIHEWQWHYPHWVIDWVGASSSKYIMISADPTNAISNGHFTVFNPYTTERVHLVLNRLGRVNIEPIKSS
jgi:type IV fimbrial biogenesis protein FimT